VQTRSLRRLGMAALMAGLSAGCAAHLQTRTVQSSDTYDLWASRLEHMPFVFHLADGHADVYDVHGRPWTGPTDGLQDGHTQRVEVYVGTLGAPSAAMCSPLPPGSTGASEANVVAAICDRSRTVVSFSDHVRDRVLASKTEYVPRVRHMLLEGIWESVAQEPAPLHS
jgi:hypothetical protein